MNGRLQCPSQSFGLQNLARIRKRALSARGTALPASGQAASRLTGFYFANALLGHNLDDLLLEVRKDAENSDMASNAFSGRHKGKRVAVVAKLATPLDHHRLASGALARCV